MRHVSKHNHVCVFSFATRFTSNVPLTFFSYRYSRPFFMASSCVSVGCRLIPNVRKMKRQIELDISDRDESVLHVLLPTSRRLEPDHNRKAVGSWLGNLPCTPDGLHRDVEERIP